MSHPQVNTDSPRKHPQHILYWLLAIVDVVNAGGRLAPQRATHKLLKESVDACGAERVWEGIKQFSMTFGIGDPVGVEGLFRSWPDLPSLLKAEEGQRALAQWFEKNSPTLCQAHQAFHGLVKLVPPRTTSKFAEVQASHEQRKIWSGVSQILETEEAQ